MEMRYCGSCGHQQPTTRPVEKGKKFRCGYCTWLYAHRSTKASRLAVRYTPAKFKPDYSAVNVTLDDDGAVRLSAKQPSDSGTTLR